MKAYYELTKQQWLWVWQRYCEGYTLKDLSLFLGVHPETIRRRFRKLGLQAEVRANLMQLDRRRGEFRALQEERCA